MTAAASRQAPLREAPAFEQRLLHEKRQPYCVAVFVINEGEKLHAQLRRMAPFVTGVDVVIADGGSTDGSVVPEVVEPLGVNAVLVKTGPGKLGAQMRMAFAWALDRGYRGVIAMDGNNKDDPEAIPRFVAALESGVDHVQGSRFVPGGISENLPFSRWLGLKALHAPLISLFSGFRYTDTTNGFRAYSARFLAEPRVDFFREVFAGYELHYYLAIRAARLGFRVAEIPVARRYPPSGPLPSKISPVRGNLKVIKALLAVCFGFYNSKGKS